MPYKATVVKVVKKGLRGPYAVASSRDNIVGSITFSLDHKVWNEGRWPRPGMSVFLDELREVSAGWRAELARFWKPSDEGKK